MSKMSVCYSKEGVITKISPAKFRELEGKTIKEAISFVNDDRDAKQRERHKQMADFFEILYDQTKKSSEIYGII
ncbi:MAG: hypothetical protein LBC19_09115 [Tannerella sp.]|jgi:hypothetical protein|nr:hypothetical protein [Tannerella sp.]